MRLYGSYVALGFVLLSGAASAAVVTVTDAKVQGGKLIVTGQTPSASQSVTLDARFTTTSNASKVFTFTLTNYLPSDCVVDLKAGTAIGQGVVANCGHGLSPRGSWASATNYLLNDLVTYGGSTWRAKIDNKGKTPATNLSAWEKFAAKGSTGAQGLTGARGPTGAQGPRGPAGPSTGPAGGDLAGSYPNPTIADGAVTGPKIADGSILSRHIATSAVGSAEIANGTIVSADIVPHGIDMSRIDGTDHYGSIGVGGISSGRCTTVTISIGGAQAGDGGMLTTDGTLPDGEVMYLQRVLADSAHVKVCNLSGGDLPAVTVSARIITFH